jgi:hypothetical protein
MDSLQQKYEVIPSLTGIKPVIMRGLTNNQVTWQRYFRNWPANYGDLTRRMSKQQEDC